jgi:hypothetical protein
MQIAPDAGVGVMADWYPSNLSLPLLELLTPVLQVPDERLAIQ